MKTYSLVDPAVKGHEFVNGNTKHLADMDQKDLKVLFKNGDARVKVDGPTEEKKIAKPAPAQIPA